MPARVAVNGEVEEGISRATDDESAATDGFARVLQAAGSGFPPPTQPSAERERPVP